MELLSKCWQRLFDPVFYRKRVRDFCRRFRRFNDRPPFSSISEVGNFRRAVVVVAHPDDETFCSGLIRRLATDGVFVKIVCLTRGEGGPLWGVSRGELGELREAEMSAACKELGVTELVFLNHIDPIGGTYRAYPPAVSSAALAEELAAQFDAGDLVVTHGSSGEYWHPAHLLIFEAMSKQVAKQDPDLTWLTFLARQPGHAMPELVNWDDDADLEIDVSAERGPRFDALRCHASQLDLFRKFAGGRIEDFLDHMSMEHYAVRYHGDAKARGSAQ